MAGERAKQVARELSPPLRRVAKQVWGASRSLAAASTALRGQRSRRWEALVQREFSRVYYDHPQQTWANTTWLGVTIWKNPLDLWIYQELLWRVRPGLIVETGTAYGGSAYYLACLFDVMGLDGRIVTIDVNRRTDRPQHDRITYVHGSSVDPGVVADVARAASGAGGVMVILDSNHERDHVLAEMRAYAPLVTPGSYLVVEDTNVNGHPVKPLFGPGPMEAVDDFLRENDDFEIDRDCEKFMSTFNPRGYLRRRDARA